MTAVEEALLCGLELVVEVSTEVPEVTDVEVSIVADVFTVLEAALPLVEEPDVWVEEATLEVGITVSLVIVVEDSTVLEVGMLLVSVVEILVVAGSEVSVDQVDTMVLVDSVVKIVLVVGSELVSGTAVSVVEGKIVEVSTDVVDERLQALTQNLWPSSSLLHPVL